MFSGLKWARCITVVVFAISLLALLMGCTEEEAARTPEDGTITGRATGAGDHNGETFAIGVAAAGTSVVLGGYEATIVGGIAEAVAHTPGTWADPVLFASGLGGLSGRVGEYVTLAVIYSIL